MFFVLLAFFFYWLLARAVQGINLHLSPTPDIDNLLEQFPLLDPFIVFFELFSFSVLRHFVPVAFGILTAWMITTELLAQLYELPNRREGGRMLSRLINGSTRTVTLDRKNFAEQQISESMLWIGGPGYLNIGVSDVAVTTINGRFERVIGNGRHRLRRFEKVVAALDLREQERELTAITLMTKDGLELKTSLTCNFYLARRPDPNNRKRDFTYDDESIWRAAFATAITQSGVRRWDDLPIHIATEQLRRIVSNKRLDQLVDPRHTFERAPYPEIQVQLEVSSRDILRQHGIHLVSASITALDMSDEIDETLLAYWKAFGEKAQALDERPQDPDFNSAEIAKRQAREKMITSLTKGLQNIRLGKQAAPKPPPSSALAVNPTQPDPNQLLTIQLLRILERFYQQQATFTQQTAPIGQAAQQNGEDDQIVAGAEGDEAATANGQPNQQVGENTSLPDDLDDLLRQFLPPND